MAKAKYTLLALLMLCGNAQAQQSVIVPATQASVPIVISTSTTTQLVALQSSASIYVTSWDVISGGTGTIQLVYGTGTSCATGQGNVTGVYTLAANVGIAKGTGAGAILVVPSGNALCATTVGAVIYGGSLSYARF